ncbi:trypsin alpha-3-like [Scaptodrosophila lebanonensis]|uniref:trypsin n=1 Tax=Drosophila lebanonensis TaxID=7225 RepID=A0A6J2U4Z9_DROLE|nr:trypsin alpha-3-like [Scaptodrosophila lebanonensis]
MFAKCFILLSAATLLLAHNAPFRGIIGGENISIEDTPWQVSLQGPSHFCGGSIYSERIIITAAHCVNRAKAENLKIRAGASKHNGVDGVLVQVAKIKVHEDYEKLGSDVALLLLSSPLDLKSSNKVKSIELAKQSPAVGAESLVSGWGSTLEHSGSPDVLQGAYVNIVDYNVCKKQYSVLGLEITEDMICAAASGKDSCQGDSGGPLVFDQELVGVVSWGYGCAREHFAGVYANVAVLRSWIVNEAAKLTN